MLNQSKFLKIVQKECEVLGIAGEHVWLAIKDQIKDCQRIAYKKKIKNKKAKI